MVKVVINDKKGIVQSPGTGVTIENAVTHSTAKSMSGQVTVSGPMIGTKPTVTNLADDGSIPVTSLFVNVDANGGARTGIRFAGAGIAGQWCVVYNEGGEKLTFDSSDSLVTGLHSSGDVMHAGGTYMFVSNGTTWTQIGGSAATNALNLQST